MPTIIRATDANRGAQATAFNFEDMAGQADRYLEKIRGEAAKIIAAAQQQAVSLKKQAEADGRQAAMKAQEQLVAQQLSGVLPALRKAVEDIQHAKHAWLRSWEQNAVHVAAAIAQRVIRRELVAQPDIPIALIREALELAAGNSQIRINLNPADHARIAGQVDMLVKEMSTLSVAEIVADPGVTPGGCRVETRFGVIDQQIESQLKRIEEELS